ncbi:MAG: cytochrome c [Burkholderiales bacterium]|nr:cytochrome c [Burkholderiales bacterium]
MKMSIALAVSAAFAAAAAGAHAADAPADKRALERGKYLARIGGCNDCHTAGYMERAGQVPESDWLAGSAVGFQGPWGTTYPANLRLLAQSMSEGQWVARFRTEMRPPMPWFNLKAMSDADVRALYAFVRSLGAKGDPMPAYVPPGQAVTTPYFVFVPQNLPAPLKTSAK